MSQLAIVIFACGLLTPADLTAAQPNHDSIPTGCACEPCGQWNAYKDERCFKVYQNTRKPFDDASNFCQTQGGSLVTIESVDEQNFVANLIHNETDNIWVGAKYTDGVWKWVNGKPMKYTNWGPGSPKNLPDYCAEMSPFTRATADPASNLKWTDVLCRRSNLVVCQKPQLWTMTQFQEIFREQRKNLVPQGFIYVQLGGQPDPKTLWPFNTWKDITSNYAGQFFRAEGGGSAEFGMVQQGNAPRLSEVTSQLVNKWEERKHTVVPIGGTSNYLWSGDDVGGTNGFLILRFKDSGGEVRPTNQAIRIWKRE